MVSPSGEQYPIEAHGYRAVVTECGAGLRLLEYDGRPLLHGYPEQEQASAGKGQLLVPWPNRIADGSYTFEGTGLQLPISEVGRNNASHGLVRWAAWTLAESTGSEVVQTYRLMSQTGYPWTLDLRVRHTLSPDGLTVTVRAENTADSPAPYALGSHPYLTAGLAESESAGSTAPAGINGWELTLPASTWLTVDERKIPTGRADVADSELDFRTGRTLGETSLDTAFTDLDRDPATGRTEVVLRDPPSGRTTVLWMDGQHRWLQVFTGDDLGEEARTAVAVEPMTSPPNAFRTGEDLVVLDAAGRPGATHEASWGIRAGQPAQ